MIASNLFEFRNKNKSRKTNRKKINSIIIQQIIHNLEKYIHISFTESSTSFPVTKFILRNFRMVALAVLTYISPFLQ